MQKKFLLFDFDGVLTDTFLSTYAICQLSRPWITEEEYRDLFMGNIYEELESQNKVETRLVIPQSNEEYFEKYFELTETHELFIISSSYNYIIEEMLGREKMLQHFRKILGADVEINKAKKIASVFSEYNASAESAIFITDTVGDVKEARKAGVDSIAVTWGNHGADRLQTVNPFAIVNSPTELLQIIQSL